MPFWTYQVYNSLASDSDRHDLTPSIIDLLTYLRSDSQSDTTVIVNISVICKFQNLDM